MAIASYVDAEGRASAEEHGVDLTLDLKEACANFYMLEWLAQVVKDTEARARFDAYSRYLARSFAAYLELAIGGELRHVGNGDNEDDYCDNCGGNGTIDCSVCDGYETISCTECGGNGIAEDVDGNEIPCEECGSEGATECMECEGGQVECEMCGASGYIHNEQDLSYYGGLAEEIRSHGSRGSTRNAYWDVWRNIVKQYDSPNVYHEAYKLFAREELWASGYGGEGWATAAEVVHDWRHGKLKPSLFVDRCWTLQHNNGCIFDKLWMLENLQEILQKQAENDYGFLSAYASPDVRRMWIKARYRYRENHDDVWLGVQSV